jgi:outer membrane protein assembly factor BamA
VVSSPSEDGNLIAFASDASDLVLGDTNGVRDVFLCDRTSIARWLNYGSGFALTYATPIGPLRFDIGFPFERPPGDAGWVLYFAIGYCY